MRKLLLIALCFISIFANSQILINPKNKGKILLFQGGTSNLPIFDARYSQSAEGADLVDATGTYPNLPYVSGTGVDQIFDFAPLSDDRFDKGAYIGNGASKPEYYDFPYSANIYYDAANPTYWKLKDFHYRYYEEQADALTNLGFAKLTYSSGVLQSSDELLLYLDAKSLTCLSAGLVYKANTVAYGNVFEASIISEGITISSFNSDRQDAIASNFDGYNININASIGKLSLVRRNAPATTVSLFGTANGYLTLGQSYDLKIMRNSTTDEYVTGAVGTFAVYIKGGSFGNNYVLVDPTGGTGTNPVTDNVHTTSAYTVLDYDADDKITNYSINGTRLNMADFTVSTGAYAANSELEGTELTKIKTYINLMPGTDFYKNEIQP